MALPSPLDAAVLVQSASDTRLPVQQTLVVRSTPFFLESCRLPGKLQTWNICSHLRLLTSGASSAFGSSLTLASKVATGEGRRGVCYGWRPPCLPSAPEMTLSLEKPGERPQDPGLPLTGDHRWALGPQGVSLALPKTSNSVYQTQSLGFGEASKSLYALIKPPREQLSSPRIHMLWVLGHLLGEGRVQRGGSCLSSLGGLVLKPSTSGAFRLPTGRRGRVAWASSQDCCGLCFSC